MGFEGRASDSSEVNGDLSGPSWLKMRRLCADAVAWDRLGVLGGAGEGERRFADDLRMTLEGYEGR